jgi:hypothetical protein
MPAKIEKIERKPDGRTKNGGARSGAGRKPRGPGKVKFDLRMAAQDYSVAALATLAAIAADTEAPHAARVAASNALLDRGHGKPVQAIEGKGDDGQLVIRIVS